MHESHLMIAIKAICLLHSISGQNNNLLQVNDANNPF